MYSYKHIHCLIVCLIYVYIYLPDATTPTPSAASLTPVVPIVKPPAEFRTETVGGTHTHL
jgi:hypothetical protein